MGLLSDEDLAYLKTEFQNLEDEVPITVVTHESALVVPGAEVPYGREVRLLFEEVAAQSPKIRLSVEDVMPSAVERLEALGAPRMPAILFGAPGSARLRFFGLPAGYEMSTMVGTILDLGTGKPPVRPEIATELARLKSQVHIQVFVTPS